MEIEPCDVPRPCDRPVANAGGAELLPDLDQEAPTELLLVAMGDALWLEGQCVDVTDVPGGTYVLVHRVNAEDRLRETSRVNNAASAVIRLERRVGGTRLAVLAVCPEDDRCRAPSTP